MQYIYPPCITSQWIGSAYKIQGIVKLCTTFKKSCSCCMGYIIQLAVDRDEYKAVG